MTGQRMLEAAPVIVLHGRGGLASMLGASAQTRKPSFLSNSFWVGGRIDARAYPPPTEETFNGFHPYLPSPMHAPFMC